MIKILCIDCASEMLKVSKCSLSFFFCEMSILILKENFVKTEKKFQCLSLCQYAKKKLWKAVSKYFK